MSLRRWFRSWNYRRKMRRQLRRATRDIEPRPRPKPFVSSKAPTAHDEPLARARKVVPNELGDAIARMAEGEIGVREEPKDSNRGAQVERYQAATWLEGTGWPWCAAFVCWCVRAAIGKAQVSFKRPRTAGAWDFERWAKKEGVSFLPEPKAADIQRGDIVIFTFSHIGIATGSPVGNTVPTVEGNTDESGSREGGGVYSKQRHISKIRSRIRLTL